MIYGLWTLSFFFLIWDSVTVSFFFIHTAARQEVCVGLCVCMHARVCVCVHEYACKCISIPFCSFVVLNFSVSKQLLMQWLIKGLMITALQMWFARNEIVN